MRFGSKRIPSLQEVHIEKNYPCRQTIPLQQCSAGSLRCKLKLLLFRLEHWGDHHDPAVLLAAGLVSPTAVLLHHLIGSHQRLLFGKQPGSSSAIEQIGSMPGCCVIEPI